MVAQQGGQDHLKREHAGEHEHAAEHGHGAVSRATVTAKVKLSEMAGTDPKVLTFAPDYAHDANKEWSLATPHLDLRMTVRADVAKHFHQGKSYTLYFEPES